VPRFLHSTILLIQFAFFAALLGCARIPGGGGLSAGGGGGSTGTEGASQIAFVYHDASINHLRLMDVDSSGIGSNPRRLTSDLESEDVPNWSPDGTMLVYQRAFNGAAVYIINADGTGEKRLSATPSLDVTPSWSPDGTQIVYSHLDEAPQPNLPPMTEIHIMNLDGSGDHAILTNKVFCVEPHWSINNQIVFMSLMGGSTLDIYTINTDGSSLTQLTSNGANNADPVWSPDGTKITFGSDREGGGKLNVFIMNADGSNQTQLTHFDLPIEAGDTNWSSDSKKIAFERDINGQKQSDPNALAEVWTMNPDGTGAASTTIPCSDAGCAPRWRPRPLPTP